MHHHTPAHRSIRSYEGAVQVLQQAAHHHRGRDRGIVLDALAHVADAEHVAGREQGLEEEVEVVFAPGAVALARLHGHEVEPACVIPAGEGFMVHAHEADHLERDAPHGQHGAEGDPAL